MTIICSVCEMFTWKCPRCPQQLELLQPTEFQLLQVVPDCGMSEPLVLPNNFIDHFLKMLVKQLLFLLLTSLSYHTV